MSKLSPRDLADLEQSAQMETDAMGSFTLETMVDSWIDYLTPDQVEEGLRQLESDGIIKQVGGRWSQEYAYVPMRETLRRNLKKIIRKEFNSVISEGLMEEASIDEEMLDMVATASQLEYNQAFELLASMGMPDEHIDTLLELSSWYRSTIELLLRDSRDYIPQGDPIAPALMAAVVKSVLENYQ